MRKVKFISMLLFFSILLLGVCCGAFAMPHEEITISDEMCLDSAATMCIGGSVYSEEGSIKNDGMVTVRSLSEVEIYLPSLIDGDGYLSLTGDYDFYLSSLLYSDCEVPNLIVNTTGDYVSTDVNLTVKTELQLLDGIVDVQDGAVLMIDNEDVDAIVYEENTPTSYVVGFLGRSVLSSDQYYYPVGDYDMFHPMLLKDIDSDTKLNVLFDETIPQEWQTNSSVSNVLLLEDLGWEVASNETNSGSFSVGLSKYTDETLDEEEYKSVFYSPDRTYSSYNLDDNSYWASDYLMSTQSNGLGVYAISIEHDLGLANFFYVGGGNATKFKIPDADAYSSITIHVVDRLGKLVFKSDDYQDDFDVSKLETGTYFYELTLKEENYERTVYNFIEVKNEFK